MVLTHCNTHICTDAFRLVPLHTHQLTTTYKGLKSQSFTVVLMKVPQERWCVCVWGGLRSKGKRRKRIEAWIEGHLEPRSVWNKKTE